MAAKLIDLSFTLNGRKVKVQIAPDTMLFALLREQGCASVRCACETTNCGLCTVWLDGDPVLSCSVPAARVEGRSITTLEGLKAESEALARAMAAEGAEQCGFCAPGLIMNVLALARAAKEDPSLVSTREELSRQLAGNLCRCSGYESQLRAIVRFLNESGVQVGLRCLSCPSTRRAPTVSRTSRSPRSSPRRTRRPCSRVVPSTRATWYPPARSSSSSSAVPMPRAKIRSIDTSRAPEGARRGGRLHLRGRAQAPLYHRRPELSAAESLRPPDSREPRALPKRGRWRLSPPRPRRPPTRHSSSSRSTTRCSSRCSTLPRHSITTSWFTPRAT